MKHKLSISIDRQTLEEIESLVAEGIFRNRSHAVEYSIQKLMEQENGR